jgi:hypothetical protein
MSSVPFALYPAQSIAALVAFIRATVGDNASSSAPHSDQIARHLSHRPVA